MSDPYYLYAVIIVLLIGNAWQTWIIVSRDKEVDDIANDANNYLANSDLGTKNDCLKVIRQANEAIDYLKTLRDRARYRLIELREKA